MHMKDKSCRVMGRGLHWAGEEGNRSAQRGLPGRERAVRWARALGMAARHGWAAAQPGLCDK